MANEQSGESNIDAAKYEKLYCATVYENKHKKSKDIKTHNDELRRTLSIEKVRNLMLEHNRQ